LTIKWTKPLKCEVIRVLLFAWLAKVTATSISKRDEKCWEKSSTDTFSRNESRKCILQYIQTISLVIPVLGFHNWTNIWFDHAQKDIILNEGQIIFFIKFETYWFSIQIQRSNIKYVIKILPHDFSNTFWILMVKSE